MATTPDQPYLKMTAETVRALGVVAREEVDDFGVVRLEVEPGNGTRYDLMIVEDPTTLRKGAHDADHSQGDGRAVWLVFLMSTIQPGYMVISRHDADTPMPGYIADKLTSGNRPDSVLIYHLLAGFLNAEARFDFALSGVSPD